MQETRDHTREKRPLQPQPKHCRALHGGSLLSNALSPFHLGSRTIDLLGNRIGTRCKFTTKNGLTRQMYPV
jgi:hypothetical protein